MPELEQISPANALAFKAVRLRAREESPQAFGSTHAKEIQLSDADWRNRAAEWSSDRSIGYLATNQDTPCGIVAAFLNEHDRCKAHLVSMWVDPSHRRVGIGRTLIQAVRAWALLREARILRLTVTSANHTAIRFYKTNGFSMTGNTEPYPNDPALFEYEMSQDIAAVE